MRAFPAASAATLLLVILPPLESLDEGVDDDDEAASDGHPTRERVGGSSNSIEALTHVRFAEKPRSEHVDRNRGHPLAEDEDRLVPTGHLHTNRRHHQAQQRNDDKDEQDDINQGCVSDLFCEGYGLYYYTLV